MSGTVTLGKYPIGRGHPCFVIAEAGVNHNGDPVLAHKLVDAAADSGASAVKFQTFKAERLVTSGAPKAEYQMRTTGEAESQLQMLKRLELSRETHLELIEHCNNRELIFLSSPFEEGSADELLGLGLTTLKLPSGELTNIPFLRHVASKGPVVILSTGMSSIGEVEQAVQTFRKAGNEQLILLHCVSNYPAAASDCNLRAMATMETAFGLPVGYSDHSEGIEIAIAAVALGACVIEKHFTLDRNLPGPDHGASSEPHEFREMVNAIRAVEAALGDGRKLPAAHERETANVARKSIVSDVEIPAGCTITMQMLALRRPGTGLEPAALPFVTGRKARQLIPADTVLSLEMLA